MCLALCAGNILRESSVKSIFICDLVSILVFEFATPISSP